VTVGERVGPDQAGDLWLVRHGETEWARLGRHTGRTDVPLTDVGRDQARDLGRRLAGHRFDLVLTSPLSRTRDTAVLAGFGAVVQPDPDLMEWDYGSLEGRETTDIRVDYPGWSIWRGPWPDGETIAQVAARADRIVARVRAGRGDGDALVFGHGHLLRVLAARWLGLAPEAGGLFALDTATISVLGWEHGTPVVETWNTGGLVALAGRPDDGTSGDFEPGDGGD
jgi:probable phosphoglycerate mutase